MPFAIQNTMILLAPVLFAASIYMTLGRVIRAVGGDRFSPIRPTRLTKLFVAGDVLSLAIQGSAAGLMVISSLANTGRMLVIVGLVVQIVIFGLFCITAVVFHCRMKRDVAAAAACARGERLGWEQILRVLYAVSALIMARSLFRVVEFVMGNDGYLLSTEWPIYVFDAVPMLIVMVVYWRWWPSMVGLLARGGEDGNWGVMMTSVSDLSPGATNKTHALP